MAGMADKPAPASETPKSKLSNGRRVLRSSLLAGVVPGLAMLPGKR